MILKNKKTNEIAEFGVPQGDDWVALGESELNTFLTTRAKKNKIKEIKRKCGESIYEVYKDFDQRNIDREAFINQGDGVKQQAQIDMNDFINLKRQQSEDFEDTLGSLNTLEEINNINITF